MEKSTFNQKTSGKEYFKKNVYITESLCCMADINTTLQINCTPIKKVTEVETSIMDGRLILKQRNELQV